MFFLQVHKSFFCACIYNFENYTTIAKKSKIVYNMNGEWRNGQFGKRKNCWKKSLNMSHYINAPMCVHCLLFNMWCAWLTNDTTLNYSLFLQVDFKSNYPFIFRPKKYSTIIPLPHACFCIWSLRNIHYPFIQIHINFLLICNNWWL